MDVQQDRPKAGPKEVREYFGCSLPELKELKAAPSVAGNGNAYDDIAFGIGDGSFTY